MQVYGKKRIGILAGILLISVLGGCGETKKTKQEEKESLRIGISVYDQYDTFMAELITRFQECARDKEKEWEIPIKLDIRNAEQSQLFQNKQVDDFIEEGCDVLCINLVDRTDASTIIEKAKSSDVPVIFYNRELVEEDLERWEKLYYVGADAFESGRMQGEILVEQCRRNFNAIDKNKDGILQYIMLEGEAGHNDSLARSMSVIQEITENGYAVEKLADEIANWSRDQAVGKMTSFLERYGEKIEVVLANNDDMALGAADALEDYGISADSPEWPVILGVDGTAVGLKAVEEGKLLGTVVNDAAGQAKGMMELAGAIAAGQPMGKEFTLLDEKYVRLPYRKVTQ